MEFELEWNHVGIATSDVDLSINFYRDVFGLAVKLRRPARAQGKATQEVAFVGNDQFTVEIIGPTEICQRARKPQSWIENLGPVHISLYVQSLVAFEKHCNSLGFCPTKMISNEGLLLGMQVIDPSGVVIELVECLEAKSTDVA